MCHYCDEFGDPEIGGGLWYLNPTGYARNMYKLRKPGQGYQGPEADLEFGEVAPIGTNDLIDAIEKGDWAEFDRMRHAMQKRNEDRGFEGQCGSKRAIWRRMSTLSTAYGPASHLW